MNLHRLTPALLALALSLPAIPLAAQTQLIATGREGTSSSRLTFLDSIYGSPFATPTNGLEVWCVNAGVESAPWYAANNPHSPALSYDVVSFSTVSANAAHYIDNDYSWPDYNLAEDPFGKWAEAAIEYAFTYQATFASLVAQDGYTFYGYYMQDVVSEIAHESALTFGTTSDDSSNRGHIFTSPNPTTRLVDAYFDWMKYGTATLDGHTWTNTNALYSTSYDNTEIQVLYLDRNHDSSNFHLTQDYIAIVPVPEPGSMVLLGLSGLSFILRRKRSA